METIKDSFLNLIGLTYFYEKIKSMIGIARGYTGTKAEVEQAIENGEIKDGMIVNITNDYTETIAVDNVLSETSENPIQNKVVTAAVNNALSAVNNLSSFYDFTNTNKLPVKKLQPIGNT